MERLYNLDVGLKRLFIEMIITRQDGTRLIFLLIGRKRMKKREDEYFVILYYTYNDNRNSRY